LLYIYQYIHSTIFNQIIPSGPLPSNTSDTKQLGLETTEAEEIDEG